MFLLTRIRLFNWVFPSFVIIKKMTVGVKIKYSGEKKTKQHHKPAAIQLMIRSALLSATAVQPFQPFCSKEGRKSSRKEHQSR